MRMSRKGEKQQRAAWGRYGDGASCHLSPQGDCDGKGEDDVVGVVATIVFLPLLSQGG